MYIDECRYVRRVRPETVRSAIQSFTHFSRLVPEAIALNDVTPEIVTVFFSRLQTRERTVGKLNRKVGIKDSTLVSYAGRLKTFFKWLKQRKYIESNPFEVLRLPKPLYSDKRALSGEQIRKIMGAAAQSVPNPFLLKRDMAMIGILTFCGLRRNELVSLEVRDVDLFSGFITIRAETSKSKITRKVPINTHLKLYLTEYLSERKRRGRKSEFLFVSNNADRRFTSHGLKHWVERLVRTSGVKFHLHRFRHTFATNLAMQNVGAIKIQKLMGHHDIKMTETYLRSVSTEDLVNDVNKLSFENLV